MLPGGPVDLPDGPAVDGLPHVVVPPQRLRVIADEVLRARADAAGPDAADDGGGQLAREEGVLAEALEVAAGARVAVDVDGRAEDDLGALGEGLAGEVGADAVEERRVPGRGVAGRVGEGGRCQARVEA